MASPGSGSGNQGAGPSGLALAVGGAACGVVLTLLAVGAARAVGEARRKQQGGAASSGTTLKPDADGNMAGNRKKMARVPLADFPPTRNDLLLRAARGEDVERVVRHITCILILLGCYISLPYHTLPAMAGPKESFANTLTGPHT